MRRLKRFLIPVYVLAMWGCQNKQSDTTVPITTYFAPGVPVPVDIIYQEEAEDPEGKGRYYIAKLVMQTDREGILRLEDAQTSNLVQAYHVDVEHGIGKPVDQTQNSGLNDIFYDQSVRWCGKIHNNKKGRWQFCTGKDCPGGGLCIKHCIKVAGSCIP